MKDTIFLRKKNVTKYGKVTFASAQGLVFYFQHVEMWVPTCKVTESTFVKIRHLSKWIKILCHVTVFNFTFCLNETE